MQEDSRTFKIAASFARFGYRSIVVECGVSQLGYLPFELISIKLPQSPVEKQSTPVSVKLLRPIPSRLREYVRNALYFKVYRQQFRQRHLSVPLQYIPQASLYYLHSPVDFQAIHHVCRKYRVPFIYDAHDFYSGINEEDNPSVFDKEWGQPFLLELESRCVNETREVVTVSNGVARLLYKAFDCHPVVIRNCHDTRLDKVPCKTLRQVLGLTTEFLVVVVGTIKRGMAVTEIAEAATRSKVHVAFVGKGVISESEYVHMVPPVMPYEIVPFIQSADASLIPYYARSPNYKNALPNGLFQSIAAGLILLYPELPEIAKIAQKYKLGVAIDPLNPDSIMAGIAQLRADHQLYQMDIAKQELSWQNEEVILGDLVAKVLG